METIKLARCIRRRALNMVFRSRSSHIGSSLSCADILACVYGGWLHVDPLNPEHPQRDRFILSKGHAAAALYSILAECGFFPKSWLENFSQDGAKLGGHASSVGVPGVEVSTGSLGHGLSIGVGMALGAKRGNKEYRVVVLMSDGECDEGSTWEAALLGHALKLDNLLVIIDYNGMQAMGRVQEIVPLEPLAEKWKAFNWAVTEVDGHNHGQISSALSAFPFGFQCPSVIIAHTVKGKGVTFMEDVLAWHYRSPNEDELNLALKELEE